MEIYKAPVGKTATAGGDFMLEHNNLATSESGGQHLHNHGLSLGKGRLIFVIIFNLVITVAEIIGGLLSGSLALMSDAVHNLGDTVSIAFSYLSIRISEKPKSSKKTYGYGRANILAAFVNAAALIGISIFLLYESISRFLNPTEVSGNVVIIVAVIGLFGNLFSILVLRRNSKESINIRSSYLHLMSDTLSSVAVIVSGILIRFASVYWIDPLMTVLISVFIFRSSFNIISQSVNILMQGTPPQIDIEAVGSEIMGIPKVKNSHHIHVWRLDEKNIILEGHVLVADMPVSETGPIHNAIVHMLGEKFGINHAVIQFESVDCTTPNDAI